MDQHDDSPSLPIASSPIPIRSTEEIEIGTPDHDIPSQITYSPNTGSTVRNYFWFKPLVFC